MGNMLPLVSWQLLKGLFFISILTIWGTVYSLEYDSELSFGTFYNSNYTFTPLHTIQQTEKKGVDLSVDGDFTLFPVDWMDITYLFIINMPVADLSYGFFSQQLSYLTVHDLDNIDISWGLSLQHSEIGLNKNI